MTSALQAAQQQARELAEQLGLVRDGGRDSLREYTIRYRLVPAVDGMSDWCSGCGDNLIKANIYARDMDGVDVYAQTCVPCVLPTIDQQLDTDPSYIVTVEVPQ